MTRPISQMKQSSIEAEGSPEMEPIARFETQRVDHRPRSARLS